MKINSLIFLLVVVSHVARSQEMTSVFYDPRDGKEYETVFIEAKLEDDLTITMEWMSENLNYKSENSFCYNNYQEYCNVFGRLYPWKVAVNICPTGWHLARNAEWEMVMNKFGGITKTGPAIKEGGESGLNLKPAGFGEPNGAYIDIGVDGYYWKQSGNNIATPGSLTIHSGVAYVTNDQVDETHHNSVRCVKDY